MGGWGKVRVYNPYPDCKFVFVAEETLESEYNARDERCGLDPVQYDHALVSLKLRNTALTLAHAHTILYPSN